MAYTQILYHIVLRTKRSELTINQKNVSSLYKYIWGIIKNKKGKLYRINGIEDFQGWEEGYAAFTYSYKEKDVVINYIKNQQIHHQQEDTQNELKRLWKENGMDPDERYFM